MSAVLEMAPSRVALETAVRNLEDRGHALVSGSVVSERTRITPDDWADFADHWNRLCQDAHMGDGGTYRLRRYGQFNTSTEEKLIHLAHMPYEQPSYINSLNGGVKRLFEPLEPSFANHPVLQSILNLLLQLIRSVEPDQATWNIRLHPYRILARKGEEGLPTPEGLHRDGVDYIVSMMVMRHNIQGGETLITDVRGSTLSRVTLMEPMQTLIGNDMKTMHAVSSIRPVASDQPAFRDVLVIAFTRRRVQ